MDATSTSLQQWGFITACGSWEGADLFKHPVPSAATPAPTDPATDLHSMHIAYLPEGVDIERTPFHEARCRGLVWMTIQYGGSIARPPTPAGTGPGTDGSGRTGRAPTRPPPRDRHTRASRCSDATTATRWALQHLDPADTRPAWRSTTADHVLHTSVNVPGNPITAVALLRGEVDIPT